MHARARGFSECIHLHASDGPHAAWIGIVLVEVLSVKLTTSLSCADLAAAVAVQLTRSSNTAFTRRLRRRRRVPLTYRTRKRHHLRTNLNKPRRTCERSGKATRHRCDGPVDSYVACPCGFSPSASPPISSRAAASGRSQLDLNSASPARAKGGRAALSVLQLVTGY